MELSQNNTVSHHHPLAQLTGTNAIEINASRHPGSVLLHRKLFAMLRPADVKTRSGNGRVDRNFRAEWAEAQTS